MHETSYHDDILIIPALPTFNAYNQNHKFNIVNFSNKYDDIIGYKLMKQMGAIIDIDKKILRTRYTEIPIYVEQSTIKLEPRKRKIIKIPVKNEK